MTIMAEGEGLISVWVKDQEIIYFPSLWQRRYCTCAESLLRGQKECVPPHSMWCQGWLICLWDEIHLGKSACTLGRCSVGQLWKKKPDNWPKVNKGPEEVPYINDLPASLLSSSSLGGMPAPFLLVWTSLPCFFLTYTVSLRALPLVVLCL